MSISQNSTPVKLTFLLLKSGGILCLENKPWSLLITAYHQIMINCFGLAAVLEMFLGNQTLLVFVQALSSVMVYIQVETKFINLQMRRKEIGNFLEKLDKIQSEIRKDEFATNCFADAESFTFKCILFYGGSMIGYPIMSFFIGLIMYWLSDNTIPQLQQAVWLPWELTNFWNYLYGNAFASGAILSFMFYYVPYSAIQFTFTMHLSASLKTLQYWLETKGTKDKIIFQHHRTIIELINVYNTMFSGQIYVELFVAPIQPCGFAYALIKILEKFDSQVMDLSYRIVMCLVAPFVICACGQEISKQLEKLHEYSYMNNWYEETPAIRRDLLQLMTVTVNPTSLNYRRLVSFNYVCFATVIQGIYSYIMLVINFES